MTEPSTNPAELKARPLTGLVVLFTLTRTVLNTSYRMVYPYLSTFQSGLGVSLPAVSLVLTLRSLTGLLSPLFAPLADRYGRRVSMLLGLAGYSAGALLIFLFPSYLTFFAGMILMSSSYLIYLPALQAYLSDRSTYAQRARVIGSTELSWSLAFIIGVPLVGWLMGRSGSWTSPYPWLAGASLLALVIFFFVVPSDRPAERPAAHPSGQSSLCRVLANRNVQLGLAMGLIFAPANELVNLVFGLWLEDSFQLKLAALAGASLVIGLSELGGEGLSTLLADRLGKERSIAIGLAANSLSAVGLILLGRTPLGALAGLFLFYLTFEFVIVSALPLMSEALPPLRATVMASTVASFSIGRAVGALAGPLLYTVWSFPANAAAAVILNIVALVLLSRLRIVPQGSILSTTKTPRKTLL